MESVIAHSIESVFAEATASVLAVGDASFLKALGHSMPASLKNASLLVASSQGRSSRMSAPCKVTWLTLGEGDAAQLSVNPYVLTTLAASNDADVLLIDNNEVATDPVFLRACAHQHLKVYKPLESKGMHDMWDPVALPDADEVDAPVWERCPHCKLHHEAQQVWDNGTVCPSCGELYRLDSDARIKMTFDPDSFREWDEDLDEADPLEFPDYDKTLARASRSGHKSAVRTGWALLGGDAVAFGIMESTYMMGSMGWSVGEKLTRMIERATESKLPVIIFTASGGARMQEGLMSLMQMAKVSAALEAHSRAGLVYISVICDPTTGGVTASFATQGDIILAEPHALIGFAGRRVVEDTIKQKLPDDFQTAEFALEHGLIDAIVEREDMRNALIRLVDMHIAGANPMRDLMFRGPVQRPVRKRRFKTLRERFSPDSFDRVLRNRSVVDAPGTLPVVEPKRKNDGSSWENVVLARNPKRPTACYYIEKCVYGFFELHGDRQFADDGAIVGGIGWMNGRAVTVIAQEKGATLEERIARNFGCPNPEGYRKAKRLMQQAEKFGRPIVCIVDTQGAYCGVEAEERGQGNAIAECLNELSGLTVPVISAITGEGGSGGALALALANRVAMQEHAIYSVLSPEGFASILWKDRMRAPEAADVMKLSAHDARDLGIIEEVLSEGDEAAHENPEQAAKALQDFVTRSLDELAPMSRDQLREQRYSRFRAL